MLLGLVCKCSANPNGPAISNEHWVSTHTIYSLIALMVKHIESNVVTSWPLVKLTLVMSAMSC